jgi:hypothetical protein
MSDSTISLDRVKTELNEFAFSLARLEELVLARVAAAYPVLVRMSYDDFKLRYLYFAQELVCFL